MKTQTSLLPRALFKSVSVLITIALTTSFAAAQENDTLVNSLQKALEIGLKNSGSIKIAKAEIGRSKTLQKSSFNPEKTDLNFQLGQYNSAETDFAFSLQQKIEFPTVYALQGKLHEQDLERSETQLNVARHKASAQIKRAWQTLVFLNESKVLMQFKDSVLKVVFANLKDNPKDSMGLDKMIIEGYLEEIENDLQILQTDIDIAKRYLQVILNSDEVLTFALPTLKRREMDVSSMTGSLVINPLVSEAHLTIDRSITQIELEKARMMPGLSFGYFNRSMIGETTVDGGTASGSNRFSGIRAGLSIPLFYSSYKANISAAKLSRAAVEERVRNFQNHNTALIDKQASEMSKYDLSLEYYESKALPRTDEMMKVSAMAYEKGKLHLNAYLRNIERVIEIRSKYLKTLNDYNQSVIELEYALGI